MVMVRVLMSTSSSDTAETHGLPIWRQTTAAWEV
jgi:hypothetical protein